MMARVAACPENFTTAKQASERLGCGEDKYGNDQYVCLPNFDITSLIELCFNGTMGVQEKGFCLTSSEGKLIPQRCDTFPTGCPREYFEKTQLYKYPACQKINAKHRCFTSDPSCPTIENSFPMGFFFVMLVLCIIVLLLVGAWLNKKRKNKPQLPASRKTSKVKLMDSNWEESDQTPVFKREEVAKEELQSPESFEKVEMKLMDSNWEESDQTPVFKREEVAKEELQSPESFEKVEMKLMDSNWEESDQTPVFKREEVAKEELQSPESFEKVENYCV